MNYTNAKWASFSRRALAFAIDSIILMVLMNILGQVLEESLPK
jgi:hypothetical protein